MWIMILRGCAGPRPANLTWAFENPAEITAVLLLLAD